MEILLKNQYVLRFHNISRENSFFQICGSITNNIVFDHNCLPEDLTIQYVKSFFQSEIDEVTHLSNLVTKEREIAFCVSELKRLQFCLDLF